MDISEYQSSYHNRGFEEIKAVALLQKCPSSYTPIKHFESYI